MGIKPNIRNANSCNDDGSESLSAFHLSVRDFVGYVYRHGGLGGASSVNSDISPNSIHSRFIEAYKNKYTDRKVMSEYSLKTVHLSPPVKFFIQGRADIITESEENNLNCLSVEDGIEFKHSDNIQNNNSKDIKSSVNSEVMNFEVIEIKSILNANAHFPGNADILHMAQARIYAYLFLLENELFDSSIKVTVAYVLTGSFKVRYFSEDYSFAGLKAFLNDTCAQFVDICKNVNEYEILRNDSIKAMKFPYSFLRNGQKELMQAVLTSIKRKQPLFVQAPTGIGKTISALYPAIKSIPENLSDFTFYLTAKSSTQEVAKKTLKDLKEQGLIVKSIQIAAKEKICLCKDIYCDTTLCPYAVKYYENSKAAIKDLFLVNTVDFADLQKVAKKFEVCPFELSLDMALFCDIIICDYNYVFDPRVMLERFMSEDPYRLTILIDEAHNLPDRVNEMYSTSFTRANLFSIGHLLPFLSAKTQDAALKINDYFIHLSDFFASGDDSAETFDKSIPRKELFKVENICASRKAPRYLVKLLDELVLGLKVDIDEAAASSQKNELKDLFFAAKFFIKVVREFFDDSYILLITAQKQMKYDYRKPNGNQGQVMPVDLQNFDISLRCLNPSKQISKLNNGKNSTVYFSGTLKPAEYFLNLFKDNSGENNYDINNLHFDSPFPAENLWVGAITDLSVKYNDRSTSMPAIVEMIIAATSCKEGNYIVFSPSFDYMQRLHAQFEEKVESLGSSNKNSATNIYNINNTNNVNRNSNRKVKSNISNCDSNANINNRSNGTGKNNSNSNINDNSYTNYETILQSRKMSEKDRKEFLGRFAQNSGRTLVGFAVLGGIFGEGIDLVGESLSGVVIVGVGLPQRNIVQEIIKDYYSSVFGNGYDYAYRFPGFNKILQAAGRVIRSDTDRGFILLIDDRYKIPEYQALFPREWNVVYPESKKSLKNDLTEFFQY